MARITFRSFTGGEVSASLAARYDLQKAGTFLQLCENMVVNATGDIERRPGTLFMEDFGEDEAFLLPFSFNSETSESYILIFQAQKISVRSINDPQSAQDVVFVSRDSGDTSNQQVSGETTNNGVIAFDYPGLYCFCVCGAGGGCSLDSCRYSCNTCWSQAGGNGEAGRAVGSIFSVYANSSVSACIGDAGDKASYVTTAKGGEGFERGGNGCPGVCCRCCSNYYCCYSGGGGGGGSSCINIDGLGIIAPGGQGACGYYAGGYGGSCSLGNIGSSANNAGASGKVSWYSLRLFAGEEESTAITNPYSLSDVPNISYAQVGDVIYLAHRDYPLRKISRSGEYPYTWTIEDVSLNQSIAAPTPISISVTRGYEYYTCGATRCCCVYCLNETSCLGYKVSAVDSDGVESTASNERQITFRYPTDWIVGDSATFCWTWGDNDSGSKPEYYNVYRDSAGYYGFIGTTCSDVCCFVDQNFEPDTSMTPKEDWDPFADNNHPGTVTFHQQRMWLGGTRNEPTTVYASRTSDFESFRKSRPLQDDDPLEYQMATGSIDDVMWLKSFGNLFVGTTGGEFTASSSGAALTPEDVQINLQSSWGSRGVMPLLVGNAILHVRRNGSRVMELAYSWENDSYSGNDLTLLAPHMVEDSPIRQWCFTQSPEPRIWAVREDGALICCTYIREQNIYAWSRHTTDGKFVSIISLCGSEADEIVLLVKREVEGETHYLLERFAPRFDDNTAIEDAFFVDCGVVIDNSQGESELESSSLAHLAGKTVSVLNVGSPEMGHTVVNLDVPEPEPDEPSEPDDDDVIITPPEDDGDGDGDTDAGGTMADKGRLTLQYGVPGKVIVGLPFTSVMAPLLIDSENDSGSSVGLQRALGKASIRVHRSVNFEYAATKSGWLVDRSAYKEAEFFEAPFLPENYGEPVSPFSGTVEVIIPGGQEEDSSLYIKTDKPTPLRVLSITADIDFGETR